MEPKNKLHGYEAYRDVYFKIEGSNTLSRFGVSSVSDMFNGVYTKIIEQGGEVFLNSEDMKKEGYFFVPPPLIQGDITVRRDFNLIDEFEITVIANFLETSKLKVLETSTGNERYNQAFAGSKVEPLKIFDDSNPYYPMMDTILLGNLYVKAKLGYIQKPEHSINIEGICVGITPNFRADGYPLVTLTFRDVGWALGKHVFSATYPVLAKDTKLEGKIIIGDIKNDGR